MIGLYYPNTDSSVWIQSPDSRALWGPFTLTGEYALESIVFDAFGDTFNWSKGIHGDNNVEHNRITGQIVYNPSAESFVRDPANVVSPTQCLKGMAISTRSNKISERIVPYGFNPEGLLKTRTYNIPSMGWMDVWMYWWHDIANGRVRSYELHIYKDDYRRVLSWNAFHLDNMCYDTVSKYGRFRYSTASWTNNGVKLHDAPLEIDEYTMRNLPEIIGPAYAQYGTFTVVDENYASYAFRIDGMLLSPKQAFDVVKESFLECLPSVEEDEPHIYQSLVARAVNQVDYRKLNIYEFLQGFTKPQQLIPKLLNLKKLKAMKAIAGDYLSYIYGILPTINDLGDILAYFRRSPNYYDRNGFVVFTAVESSSTTGASYEMETVWRAKIAIDEEDPRWLDLRKQYDNLGRLPTVKEIWELIPYSFVVDWFVGVGDMLSSLQAEGYKLRLPIRYYTFSKKSVTRVFETIGDGALVFNLTRTNYRRWVTDHCPSVFLPPEFETTFLDRWIEGAALIIARKR